jgi:hypothetical protein
MMSSGSELSGAQPTERERHLRVLADKLPFKVEKRGDRFTLSRTIPGSCAACKVAEQIFFSPRP